MSATRKPRSDAKLKTLPPERQEQIAEYALSHSLVEVRAWLAEDGLVTSVGALSEFLSWFLLRQQLRQNESTVESVLNQLQEQRPDLTEGQLFAAGQSFFSALAIEQRDSKSWKRTQDLLIKRDLLRLEERKFQRETCELFLRWHEDQQARAIAGSAGTNADKIERLGELMFGEDWK